MARTPKVVEDRKEQILDAAMRVFSLKGFTKATNKDIAREAGITPGLIYYYFESKEAVLKAILDERSPFQLINSIPPEILQMPVEVFLPLMIERGLNIVEGENFKQLFRVLISEVIYNQDLAKIVRIEINGLLTFLGHYLESRMEKGELRRADVGLTSQVFAGSLFGFVLRREILLDPIAIAFTHEQIAQTITETVLKGLLPRS